MKHKEELTHSDPELTRIRPRLNNLDWFITKLCNQTQYCPFCYAPRNAFEHDSNLQTAVRICERIAEIKTEKVTLCGGEPTQYPHLITIIQKLHHSGIQTILYSNAVSNPEFDWHHALPHLYMLSLPIDSISPEVTSKMRGPHQIKAVIRLLDYIAKSKIKPKIKIGTVVTKQNIHELVPILTLLNKLAIIDVWRLYQFSPYGIGKTNQEDFLISNDEFLSAVTHIKNQPHPNIKIAERSREDNINYCYIMDSQGNFYRYEEEYIPLKASIFDPPERILTEYDVKKNIRQKLWQ